MVANAALFFGLLSGFLAEGTDVAESMDFSDAKRNFFSAARHGLKAQFRWFDGSTQTAADLLLGRLIPFARDGLASSGIDAADIDHYLDIIKARVRSKQTGAAWMLNSLASMDSNATADVKERALTSAMLERQLGGKPVHTWELARSSTQVNWNESYRTVEQFMSRKLFTVRPDDLVDMAACLMDWEHIKHVPVEDDDGKLVGIVTHRALLRLLTRGKRPGHGDIAIADIMRADPITVAPQTRTLEAMRLMREKKVSCLPVVENGALVGIITERDLIEASVHLLERFLEED
jgi:CBS domain-containing protein